jgi:serine/threonine protein phosphatase PrpC
VWTITTTDRGVLVMCTDGLWNYLPEADDIAGFCIGKDADVAARALVDYALAAGGHDNITVAVIPIGGLQ